MIDNMSNENVCRYSDWGIEKHCAQDSSIPGHNEDKWENEKDNKEGDEE